MQPRTTAPARPGTTRALSQLADPRLNGAACAGPHAHLFDDALDEHPHETNDQRRHRHDQARAICQRCPVQAPCRTVANELGRYALGVWAGRKTPPKRKPGRPTRKATP